MAMEWVLVMEWAQAMGCLINCVWPLKMSQKGEDSCPSLFISDFLIKPKVTDHNPCLSMAPDFATLKSYVKIK